MGRQNKVPLPYFELDCHMDDKIKLIQAEFGLKGFAVVVKLYQRIYGGEFGYYCEWDEERSLLFALENGLNGDGKNLINNIVSACIKRNIFSDRLYKEYGILTSHGVQKQYLKATAKREVVELKKEYLLISVPENRHNVVINPISDGINVISGGRNTQSKAEESRQDKSILENNTPLPPHRGEYYPDELLNQAFLDFLDMRKKIRKPMTDRAIELAMKKLKELSTTAFSGGMDNDIAIKILEQSTMNCWQGLFPLKEEKKAVGSVYDEWRNA